MHQPFSQLEGFPEQLRLPWQSQPQKGCWEPWFGIQGCPQLLLGTLSKPVPPPRGPQFPRLEDEFFPALRLLWFEILLE